MSARSRNAVGKVKRVASADLFSKQVHVHRTRASRGQLLANPERPLRFPNVTLRGTILSADIPEVNSSMELLLLASALLPSLASAFLDGSALVSELCFSASSTEDAAASPAFVASVV